MILHFTSFLIKYVYPNVFLGYSYIVTNIFYRIFVLKDQDFEYLLIFMFLLSLILYVFVIEAVFYINATKDFKEIKVLTPLFLKSVVFKFVVGFSFIYLSSLILVYFNFVVFDLQQKLILFIYSDALLMSILLYSGRQDFFFKEEKYNKNILLNVIFCRYIYGNLFLLFGLLFFLFLLLMYSDTFLVDRFVLIVCYFFLCFVVGLLFVDLIQEKVIQLKFLLLEKLQVLFSLIFILGLVLVPIVDWILFYYFKIDLSLFLGYYCLTSLGIAVWLYTIKENIYMLKQKKKDEKRI